MPTRPRNRKPVTIEELETFLDYIAVKMVNAGESAELFLPIWRALERELAARRQAATIFAAAKERVRRSTDQTSARS